MRRVEHSPSRRATLTAIGVAVVAALAVLAAPAVAEEQHRLGQPDRVGFKKPGPTHIVGGKTSPSNAYPFYAAVVNRQSDDPADGFMCGGAVIGAKRVVTAAHCSRGTGELDVYVGGNKLHNGTGTRIHVKDAQDLATGDDWDGGFLPKGDLAILELNEAVPNANDPSSILQVASPSEFQTFAAAGKSARVIGHGQAVPDGLPENDLREADLDVVSDAACALAYENGPYGPMPIYAGDQICVNAKATSPSDSACHGDSGGPLMVDVAPVGMAAKWRLVGTVSGGIECSSRTAPGVYAQVDGHQGFLSNPAPIFKPASLKKPTIEGSLRVGETVTCNPGSLTNSPTSVEFLWAIADSPDSYPMFLSGEEKPTLKLTGKHEDGYLLCIVTASNRGGENSFFTEHDVGPIQAQLQPTVSKPVEKVTTVKTPVKPDKQAPRALAASISCKSNGVCTVIVATPDGESSSGIAQVTAKVTTKLAAKTKVKRKSKQKRSVTSVASVTPLPGGDWKVTTKRLPKGRSTLEVTVADKAGNRQSQPTRIALAKR